MIQATFQAVGMDNVLEDLNTKILDQCRSYLDRNEIFIDEYSTLDIDKEIDQMNPTLWKAICMLTRSVSERRGIANKQIVSNEQNEKRLRRFFLLLFCADDHCSMPMHILLADLIESQGGSVILIQALNKLRVCSSQKRLIQSKVDTCDAESAL